MPYSAENPEVARPSWRDPYAPSVLQGLLIDAEALVEKDGCAARACLKQALTLVGEQMDGVPGLEPSQHWVLLASWQIRKVVTFVETNIGECIRISELAAIVGLRAGYFSRAFRDCFGLSPHAYITRQRMALAQRMLLQTDEPLAQIALACGLCDQAHLSRLFRQAFGVPPAKWRRSRRGEEEAGSSNACLRSDLDRERYLRPKQGRDLAALALPLRPTLTSRNQP